MRVATIATVVACVLVTGTRARGATCTITDGAVPVASQGLTGRLTSLVGVGLPVTIDEASGGFAIDFSGVAPAEFSLSGISSSLLLGEAGAVSGTIDGAGNVVLPAVSVRFTTTVIEGVLGAPATLTSGIAAVTLAGVDYPTEGSPLDFATGALRVAGQAVLLNAPIVGQVTTGFELDCTLAPVPSQDALPRGNVVTARGTVKPGAADADPVEGDTLKLKATVKPGATPFDPTQDVFVRVALAGTNLMLLRAPAGALTGSGKKLVVSNDDGSALHLITGRKMAGNTPAAVSGSLVVVRAKKKITLKLTHTGADLAALASAGAGSTATVTIGMGSLAASDSVTIKPGKKKTALK